jgi:Zn-dependent alcohol dehydrogenase
VIGVAPAGAEINTAFELMKRGESIRGVVTF